MLKLNFHIKYLNNEILKTVSLNNLKHFFHLRSLKSYIYIKHMVGLKTRNIKYHTTKNY